MGNPVYLHYDGTRYSVPGRPMDEIEREIADALTTGTPYWLEVNYGEGRPSKARVLITPGVAVALHEDIEPGASAGL